MKKRTLHIFLVVILLLGLVPSNGFAANELVETNIIYYEDGSYLELFVETSSTRAANTVSGSKKCIYRDSDGNVEWEAKLTATFAYSGAWYTCTAANCNVTVYDTKWYEISNTTTRSSNNAFTNLTMGRRLLGVTVDRPQYTIKLTCDSSGNLS